MSHFLKIMSSCRWHLRHLRMGAKPFATVCAAALNSSALAVSAAWAQTPAAEAGALEEVVVTATRRAESVLEIPFNITAIQGTDIERKRITNLVDLAQNVPGLFLVDQGPRADNLIVVRGINSTFLDGTESLDNKAGGSVSTYLGDIPLNLDLKPFDIERIEVLLGPQGTLYGIDTLAGAIRYLPNRPDLANTTLKLGSDLYGLEKSHGLGTRTTAVFNLPIAADKLALRLGAQYTDDPGFIDNDFLIRNPGVSNPEPDRSDPAAVATNLVRKQDVDDEQTWSARAALRWAASDSVQADLTYYFQDQRIGGRTVNNRQAFATDDYVSAVRFLEPNRTKNELTALEIDADLGFAKLTSATGYSKFDQRGQRDLTDGLLIFSEDTKAAFPDDPIYFDFPAFAAFTRDLTEEKTVSQELRLVSKGPGPFSWIGGAFYQKFEEDNNFSEFTPGYPQFLQVDRADNLEALFVINSQQRQRALFGELSYQLSERWQTTVGARWFDMSITKDTGSDFPIFNAFIGQPTDAPLEFLRTRSSDDGLIKKFSSSYRLGEATFGYFTVAEGYREGGLNAIQPCSTTGEPQGVCLQPDEIEIKPDRTTNYELGLRTKLGKRVQLNGTLFSIDWRDIQVQSFSEVGDFPITVNGSEARSRGLELQANARLTDRWLLDAQYTYTDAELTDTAPGIVGETDSDPTSPTYDGARKGDRLPGSPKHAGSVSTSYLQTLVGGWDFRADYGIRATSDVLTRAGKRGFGEALSGFALHHAAFSLSNDRWTARLHVENIFDRFAETSSRSSLRQLRTIGSNDFTVRSYFKGVLRPRTIGLDVTYNFDFAR